METLNYETAGNCWVFDGRSTEKLPRWYVQDLLRKAQSRQERSTIPPEPTPIAIEIGEELELPEAEDTEKLILEYVHYQPSKAFGFANAVDELETLPITVVRS